MRQIELENMPSKVLVLDFDGTICFPFRDFDMSQTGMDMHLLAKDCGFVFAKERDAFEIFAEIEKCCPENMRSMAHERADQILTATELAAVQKCNMVDGFLEGFAKLQEAGYVMAIATNNSRECVEQYFARFFSKLHMIIVGRQAGHPERMKPSPWMLEECAKLLQVNIGEICFVGDNARDCECAENAGCSFIAMVPMESKRERMLARYPEAVCVKDYYELLDLLRV